jgi:hypothetical protein
MSFQSGCSESSWLNHVALFRHSCSLPRRLGSRAPRHAALVAASSLQPLPRRHVEIAIQVRARHFPVDEVAETTSHTSFAAIEATASFAKIGDGGEFTVDGSAGVPAGVEVVASFLRVVFILEARVDIADEIYDRVSTYPAKREKRWEPLTIVVVVANDYLLNFAKLAHLAPEILVEGVEVVLQLGRVHLVLGVVGWILVEIREEDGLRVRGFDMFARAAVAVAACSYLVVERAVHLKTSVSMSRE